MIAVGEHTGALDTMLSKIADFYEDEVDEATANLLALLEPIIIAVPGHRHRRHRDLDVPADVRADQQDRRRRPCGARTARQFGGLIGRGPPRTSGRGDRDPPAPSAAFAIELILTPSETLFPLYVLCAGTFGLVLAYAVLHRFLWGTKAFVAIQVVGDLRSSRASCTRPAEWRARCRSCTSSRSSRPALAAAERCDRDGGWGRGSCYAGSRS